MLIATVLSFRLLRIGGHETPRGYATIPWPTLCCRHLRPSHACPRNGCERPDERGEGRMRRIPCDECRARAGSVVCDVPPAVLGDLRTAGALMLCRPRQVIF